MIQTIWPLLEDAIVFGCGFGEPVAGFHTPGFTRSEAYQEVMDRLTESDTVVVISAGNAGHWADNGFHGRKGYLYAEDVDMYTVAVLLAPIPMP